MAKLLLGSPELTRFVDELYMIGCQLTDACERFRGTKPRTAEIRDWYRAQGSPPVSRVQADLTKDETT